jgi:hypothetical protein
MARIVGQPNIAADQIAADRGTRWRAELDFTLSLFERPLPAHIAGGCDPEERAPMFSHVMIGSNDIARAKKFYEALFAAMGAQPGAEVSNGAPTPSLSNGNDRD